MHSSPNSSIHDSEKDSLDLLTIFDALWSEKLLIIVVTLITMTGGLVFAFVQTPVFKATLELTTPAPANLAPLTKLPLYDQISSEEPLIDFVAELQSPTVQREFIHQAPPSLKQSLYSEHSDLLQLEALKDRIKINHINADKSPVISPWIITFFAPNPLTAAAELDRLAQIATKSLLHKYQLRYEKSVKISIEKINSQILQEEKQLKIERLNKISRLEEAHQLKIKELEDEIKASKQLYSSQLRDQIRLLEEAYVTAKSLGIEEPTYGGNTLSPNKVEVQLKSDSDPIYFRGTRRLQEELIQLKTREEDFYPIENLRKLEAELEKAKHDREIEILKNRRNDTPFSSTIEQLQKRLVLLETETFPDYIPLNFHRAQASPDSTMIKPKRALILAASFLIGLILGTLGAIAGYRIKKHKSIKQS
ncbi:Wzz/FepE/Etk N-terminal domain-containing protein [Neptuniibacter sp. CAU 1671]|uniref:Wzz/FepE/Etk N-terminal domain-containing protein n=1 Tax=Neptuniibacter sp. CAU 1671 TaxID=3032593 RepID=UPI0023DC78AF|nr:Wzz/FepE/Etk N-terminal domain-containing protein [Neptuniibacter sp. CAU 1671]MDF2181419.1 Wzz/FepE/Etk N-terminal domain-containing protein [Neptuniibacter sp. CAU 1671]